MQHPPPHFTSKPPTAPARQIPPRLRAFRAVAAAAVAALGLTSSAEAQDVLYVASGVPPAATDARVIFELERMGFSVDVFDDGAVQSSDALGRDLVLVSSTVSSGSVGSKFTSVPVPVLVRESFVYDDMNLTGPSSGSDFGTASGQTVDVVGGHPLTAGLAGSVTISTTNETIFWGVPGVEAVVAATLSGNASRAAIFGYESGANLVSGTAPARRVGHFLADMTPTRWTADAQDLLRASVLWAMDATPEPRVRVATVGDSITEGGSGGFWSYRRPLGELLEADGCRVDMTGSRHGPDSGMPGDFLYDRDHEGHSGFRTDEIEVALPNWLAGNAPDLALVHLGTNDVLQGSSVAAAKENLRDVIAHLRAANPDVVVLLAQIIPNRPQHESEVLALNAHIADLAAEEDTVASPVVLVDQYTGYDSATQNLVDGIHPNASGEQHLADRFFAALQPQIAAYCDSVVPTVPAAGGAGWLLLAGVLGGIGSLAIRRST